MHENMNHDNSHTYPRTGTAGWINWVGSLGEGGIRAWEGKFPSDTTWTLIAVEVFMLVWLWHWHTDRCHRRPGRHPGRSLHERLGRRRFRCHSPVGRSSPVFRVSSSFSTSELDSDQLLCACESRSSAETQTVPVQMRYMNCRAYINPLKAVASLDSQDWGQTRGPGGRKTPSEVQGQSPGGGMGAKPPEAEENQQSSFPYCC